VGLAQDPQSNLRQHCEQLDVDHFSIENYSMHRILCLCRLCKLVHYSSHCTGQVHPCRSSSSSLIPRELFLVAVPQVTIPSRKRRIYDTPCTLRPGDIEMAEQLRFLNWKGRHKTMSPPHIHRTYLRNLDTKGEVSPRRRKWPEGPSPRNSENQDSCSISSLRIA